MNKSIMRIYTLTKRNLKEILREPLSLVFTIGLPLFMEVLFYFIFHDMTSQFAMKYLAPGIVVFSQAFLTLFTGMLIATDKSSSFLTHLYVSKAKSYEFIFAYAFAILPIALIQSILFFVVGGIIDSSIFCVGMIWAVLQSIMTALFFIALGILFGSISNEKSVGGISSIVIVGQSVLSGMWFPMDELDQSIIMLMNVLPFRNATLLIQNVLNGINNVVSDYFFPLINVILYSVIIFILAIMFFRSKMKDN